MQLSPVNGIRSNVDINVSAFAGSEVTASLTWNGTDAAQLNLTNARFRVDTDGDGLFDGNDRCPKQEGTVKGCPAASKSISTFTFRESAENIRLTLDVSAYVANKRDLVRITVVSDDQRRIVYSKTTPGSARQTVTKALPSDEFAGETVRVVVQTVGSASLVPFKLGLRRDSDGDELRNAVERGFEDAQGNTRSTDPYETDTDGDGVPDGTEVEKTKKRGVSGFETVYRLESDPTRVDTDGDGLSDREERRQHALVLAARSTRSARKLLQNDGASIKQVGASYRTSTDPALRDTDDDDLSDRRETLLHTDPTRFDTDTDGTGDLNELHGTGMPAVYDVVPPKISVNYARFEKVVDGSGIKTEYSIGFAITDASGVTRYKVIKGDTSRCKEDFDAIGGTTPRGATNVGRCDFTTGTFETLLTGVVGGLVKIRATDAHGNTVQRHALDRHNFFGAAAARLGQQTLFDLSAAKGLGLLSGFSTNLGQTPLNLYKSATAVYDTIKTLVTNPQKFVRKLRGLYETLKDTLEQLDDITLEQLVSALTARYRTLQEQNNPYSKNPFKNAFRIYFYTGYLFGFLAKTVVSAGLAAAVKSTTLYTRITKILSSVRAVRALAAANDWVDLQKIKLVRKAVDNLDTVGADTYLDTDTLTAALRRAQLQKEYDLHTSQYSDDIQQDIGQVLATGDEAAARRLAALDDQTIRRLFGCSDGAALAVGTTATDDCEDVLDDLERALGEHADHLSRSEYRAFADALADLRD